MLTCISVIVPCYNEEKNIPILWNKLEELTKKFKQCFGVELRIIYVDDGSQDKTCDLIRELSEKNENVSYISFSKNFGKEAAMYAGLETAEGDYVAIIDADLQDPPELLIEMYEIIKNEPYDCIATRRIDRKGEPPIRSWFARRFYGMMNKLSNVQIVDGARDFRLMTRQMCDSVIAVSEKNRFSKGIFAWVGYKTKWIEYENTKRFDGSSKWSFFKLLLYAVDGIVAFSAIPLAVSAVIGILFCLIAFVFIFLIIVKTILVGDPVEGWPSTICIMLFLSGIQLFCTGILGIYISKIYTETKARPIYIAKEKLIKHREN